MSRPRQSLATPTDLRRLVRNLVENAVAHATSTVVLRAAVRGEDVVLDVLDDGPGVPAGAAELVFERFHRGDDARSRRGSGLGLSIARTVAERHGGSLLLVVDDGPGAHFRLTLPVQNPLPSPRPESWLQEHPDERLTLADLPRHRHRL